MMNFINVFQDFFNLFLMTKNTFLLYCFAISSQVLFEVSLLISIFYVFYDKPIFPQRIALEKYSENQKINIKFWFVWGVCWLLFYIYYNTSLYYYFRSLRYLSMIDYIIMIILFGGIIILPIMMWCVKKNNVFISK